MRLFQISAFYAYPSQSSTITDSIKDAVSNLNSAYSFLAIRRWQDLTPGGRFIIDTVLEEIDRSQILLADLSGLNPNVLFEVGYAVGRNKRIWISIDNNDKQNTGLYKKFDLLSGIGYESYRNWQTLAAAYNRSKPHEELSDTLYDQRIAPNLRRVDRRGILHLKRSTQNTASVQCARAVASSGHLFYSDDPKEVTGQSLSWYGATIHQVRGVLVHLTLGETEIERLHNAKCALIAGLALGMDKQLLMLGDPGFESPIDYREHLYVYSSSKDAESRTRDWIDKNISEALVELQPDSSDEAPIHQLSMLSMGQSVAEQEPSSFLTEYFVETSSYTEALNAQFSIFVGRKGVGKTANLLKIAYELSNRPRHLVCTIKPPAYEMQGLARLISDYRSSDAKSYSIESLWKFLIVSEIANSAATYIQNHATVGFNEAENELLNILDQDNGLLREEFGVRLERAVDILTDTNKSRETSEGLKEERQGISEALHSRYIGRLKISLSKVLSQFERIAILIDNLDHAWDASADLADLCAFILGLLSVAPRLASEFQNERKRNPVPVTITVFLRADIFHQVLLHASEPDKVRSTRIRWTSPELLKRVIEERYTASFSGANGANIWKQYFTPRIDDTAVDKYILGKILPRPRDIVFYVSAAVENAVNRKSEIIDVEDLLEADRRYSKYAIDSILVESALGTIDMRRVVESFYGCAGTMTSLELEQFLLEARVPSTDIEHCIDELINMSFLGIEVADNDFRFLEEPEDFNKLAILGLRHAKRKADSVRYRINPPFWAHLEVVDTEEVGMLTQS